MSEGTTTIVIFGATGDLAKRKLVPALFTLAVKNRLDDNVRIVGASRSTMSDDQFRESMWDALQEFRDLKSRRQDWDRFARRLHYITADIANPMDFVNMKEQLEEMEGDTRPANRLFYLSIAPSLYWPAVLNLGATDLALEDTGWRRVVIEKPFGWDLESAQALNREVHQVFQEEQVYRIDHYLGKESVQNLLVLRFANAIFEPVWNRNYVDNIQITVAESVDVADRAAYYNESGVVRDMVQNHLLQLLTMVAMEPPSAADAESLRSKKVDVLKAIRRWETDDVSKHAIRGQYKGYLDEKGVPAGSLTGTYVAMRLYVDNWRWRDVPFYLRTGKAMANKTSEIIVQFQSPPHLMFDDRMPDDLSPNVLSVCLQPNEGTHLRFQSKVPDQGMAMRPVDMEFRYETAFRDQSIPEAYELLLEDALKGDRVPVHQKRPHRRGLAHRGAASQLARNQSSLRVRPRLLGPPGRRLAPGPRWAVLGAGLRWWLNPCPRCTYRRRRTNRRGKRLSLSPPCRSAPCESAAGLPSPSPEVQHLAAFMPYSPLRSTVSASHGRTGASFGETSATCAQTTTKATSAWQGRPCSTTCL